MAGRQQHMRGKCSEILVIGCFIFNSFYSGWKHRENFRNYYQQFYPQWMLEQQARMHMQMLSQGLPVPPMPLPMGAAPGFLPPPHGMPLPPGVNAPPSFFPPPPHFPTMPANAPIAPAPAAMPAFPHSAAPTHQ